ncbi:MAG: PAS domain S-box protein [Spirochaetia bacterium]
MKRTDPIFQVFEHDLMGIAVFNTEMEFLYVNNRFLKEFSVSKDQVIGKNHYSVFPEIPQRWREIHQKALSGEVLRSKEDFFIREDGSIDYTRWECRPWYESDEKIGGIILYTRVINTEKSEKQEHLRITAAMKALLENTPDIVNIIDKTGRYVMVSDSTAKTLNLPKAELIGKNFREVLPPEVAEEFHNTTQRVVETGEPLSKTDTIQTDDGEYVYRTTLFPAQVKDGEVELIGTIGMDVTTEHRALKELRNSQVRWQFALEGAGDGVWDWNPAANEVYFSPQWKKMLGYEDEEISNSLDEWKSRIHPDDYAQAMKKLKKHLAGETEIYSSEHRIRCKDGSYKWILDRGKVITRDNEGNPLRVIGTHSDISNRKNAEEDRENFIQQREMMLREGHHRIKNDMQTVRSLLSLQANRVENASAAEALREAADRIDVITQMYATFYQNFNPKGTFQTDTLTRDLVEALENRYLHTDIDITLESDPIVLDNRLSTPFGIIINELITNSVKHAGEDTTAVRIDITIKKVDEDTVQIAIEDNGPGYPDSVLAGNTNTFGMVILNAFVEQLKGSIALSNNPGAKTVITFPANQ